MPFDCTRLQELAAAAVDVKPGVLRVVVAVSTLDVVLVVAAGQAELLAAVSMLDVAQAEMLVLARAHFGTLEGVADVRAVMPAAVVAQADT